MCHCREVLKIVVLGQKYKETVCPWVCQCRERVECIECLLNPLFDTLACAQMKHLTA